MFTAKSEAWVAWGLHLRLASDCAWQSCWGPCPLTDGVCTHSGYSQNWVELEDPPAPPAHGAGELLSEHSE